MQAFFKKAWTELTGSASEFSMGNRAFNAMSVISMMLILVLGVFNFIIDLPLLGYILLSALGLLCFLYYLSRFKKKYLTASVIFIIASYLLLGSTFFFNSGIEGPVILMLCLTFVIITVISPSKYHNLWIVTHCLFGGFLLLANYTWPDWIGYSYKNVESQYIDLFICYIVTIIFTYIINNFLLINYENEKKLAQEKTRQLLNSNTIIRKQNSELSTLNSEKDRLFSIIAHDLRSPLSSIQSFLQIINDPSISDDERKIIEHELLGLAENTFELLNNLLHWSGQKIRGKVSEPRIISVRDYVENTISLLKPLATNKNIPIHYQSNGAPHIMGDPDMFQLVIRNILNNAIKFTPGGGEIFVSYKALNEAVEITIKDTGIGIPESKQKQLFSLGMESARGTNAESGIGLGLVLCYDFVNLMEGSIEFESEEDKGTEFKVTLPLAEAPL